jgi:hypothetical protein
MLVRHDHSFSMSNYLEMLIVANQYTLVKGSIAECPYILDARELWIILRCGLCQHVAVSPVKFRIPVRPSLKDGPIAVTDEDQVANVTDLFPSSLFVECPYLTSVQDGYESSSLGGCLRSRRRT